MAKHHPDLIMCRKQPGIGMFEISDFCPDPLRLRSPLPFPCSCWPPVREMRRQVSSVRLVCETVRAGAHLRRVQLRLLSGTT